ncbi:MAG TPA: hypothetical protein VMV44_13440 [Rectinemataceae bacterium]|nr:hypothetical protein [Rectinemataceae bacterium]
MIDYLFLQCSIDRRDRFLGKTEGGDATFGMLQHRFHEISPCLSVFVLQRLPRIQMVIEEGPRDREAENPFEGDDIYPRGDSVRHLAHLDEPFFLRYRSRYHR